MTFYCGNGTKDHSLGVVDVPCVMSGKPIQITMHVVPGEVPCLLSKGWLKENGAIIDTHAGLLKLTRQGISTLLIEGESGHHEVDLVGGKPGFGEGRTVALRSRNNLQVQPSKIPVTWWGRKTPRCVVSRQN